MSVDANHVGCLPTVPYHLTIRVLPDVLACRGMSERVWVDESVQSSQADSAYSLVYALVREGFPETCYPKLGLWISTLRMLLYVLSQFSLCVVDSSLSGACFSMQPNDYRVLIELHVFNAHVPEFAAPSAGFN
jgi:hypothetical protein